jgi:LemA protein
MRIFSPARLILLALLVSLLSGCGYNQIQQKDEAVKAGWSEVINQYKRRADLIPNLVNTVKGYAAQEQQVLIGVTEARAKVSQINVNASDAASLAQFQQAQGQLSSALSRLLVVTENYPNLKSDQSFRDLQAQLEGTENRITVARGRYIQLVQDYNTYLRSFPQNLTAKMFGYQVKPNFTVENEQQIQQPPTVEFGAPAPAPTAPAPAPAPAPATGPSPTPPGAAPVPQAPMSKPELSPAPVPVPPAAPSPAAANG